jgi:predicted phosphodiesterase
MPGRTLIISDTHLGRPHGAARSAEALRPLWQGCTHLIVNGDVAEIHHPRHWTEAAQHTLRLHDLCEQDGVALTLLSGNHDPYITDLRHLHLAGGTVFVTHGDVLHPAVAPWSPRAGRMREAHEEALAAHAPEDRHRLEARLNATKHAAHVEWTELVHEAAKSSFINMMLRPWTFFEAIRYWRALPGIAASFLIEHAPAAKFIVLGHSHRAGIWTVRERIVINTGSFGFPGKPWAVAIDDERTMSVLEIKRRGAVYALSQKPIDQFPLRGYEPIVE